MPIKEVTLRQKKSPSGLALIIGISGQDGSYLAELLLDDGYRVVGTTRALDKGISRVAHLHDRIEIVQNDLLEQSRLEELLQHFKPAEVYNLAARASSSDLFADPVATGEVNALAVIRLLEAIRLVNPLGNSF